MAKSTAGKNSELPNMNAKLRYIQNMSEIVCQAEIIKKEYNLEL